tara:strand:- start:343 stop:741 length:399 start_codon:yes stop_codon:yes gene_type:complete
MAYSSTVTKTKINNVDYVYDITETMGGDTAGTGTDFSIDVTTSGRILRYTCSADAGTVNPCVSVADNPYDGSVRQDVDLVLENATAAAVVDLQPSGYVLFYATGKKLYINNVCSNTGATVTTRIFIRDTWGL